MSNVLIGIIGVILFIGLALAGALILGSDFRTTRSSSIAAAESSRLRQVAQAIAMKNLKTGSPQGAGRVSTMALAPRFLKTGVNLDDTSVWGYIDARSVDGGLAASNPAMYVVSGAYGEIARDSCGAAAESSGMTVAADGTPPTLSAPVGEAGCFLVIGASFGTASGIYLMFQRI